MWRETVLVSVPAALPTARHSLFGTRAGSEVLVSLWIPETVPRTHKALIALSIRHLIVLTWLKYRQHRRQSAYRMATASISIR